MSNKKFDVNIERYKMNKSSYLRVTRNGSNDSTIRIDDPLHEVPMLIKELEKFLSDYINEVVHSARKGEIK